MLWVVLDGKCTKKYSVNVGVPQDSILGPTLFLLYVNDFPDDVTCHIAIYSDTTLYTKWSGGLWQQLKLASALKSDLHNTVIWGKK